MGNETSVAEQHAREAVRAVHELGAAATSELEAALPELSVVLSAVHTQIRKAVLAAREHGLADDQIKRALKMRADEPLPPELRL